MPVRVVVGDDRRPVRVAGDRRGLAGGPVVEAAGPWRTSGAWWLVGGSGRRSAAPWDRDEWDVVLGDGAVYRIFQDRTAGGWFVDAIVD